MDHKAAARRRIESQRDALVALSHAIHAEPELAYEEHEAARRTREVLAGAGFDVETGPESLPTSFVARYGNGSLNIGICAEYDALPGVGHACGHNVIAAAAVGAGIGLMTVVDELDLTVTVLGTPAEEKGGGKIAMLQNGAFDGLHAAMMVHPFASEHDAMGSLAVSQIDVTYTGRAAHAAARPEQGRNAAAALALAQAGIGMLREHMRDSDRVHGIVIDGGAAPNIVPAKTKGRWFIRSRTTPQLLDLKPKIFDVFRGAALMTGCTVEIRQTAPSYSEIITDPDMAALWRQNAAELGRTSTPLGPGDPAASTDMGNVSYAVPSIHPLLAIESGGAGIHEERFAASATNPSADQAVIDGAVGMAWTTIDMASDGELRTRLAAKPYSVADVAEDDAVYLGRDYETPIVFDPFG